MDVREKIKEINLNSFNVRDEFKGMEVPEIRKHQPKFGYSICLLNILGDLNMGTIIRSAVMFGADAIYVAGRKRIDKRSMVGSNNYIDIEYIEDSFEEINNEFQFDADVIEHFIREKDYQPASCEPYGIEISKFKDAWGRGQAAINPCFIMGNEGFGIPKNVLDISDFHVSVPQFGVMRSLNVATAASIIMYEWVKDYGNDGKAMVY